MLKSYILLECTKVEPNLWILKGHYGIGFGVIGSVSALVNRGLITCDRCQPVFEDKYVYTFLNSDRTSCVYPSFAAALLACCRDIKVNPCEGLARLILGGGSI